MKPSNATTSRTLMGLVIGTMPVQAIIEITNGDFEADVAQTANVTDWYDRGTTGNWWESTWAGPTVSPNGTSVLGLSFLNGETNWAYQGIGTNSESATDLKLQFDAGSFTDAGGDRDLGVRISVYKSDGTFVPGDDIDVQGAAGITLLGSAEWTGLVAPGATVAGISMTLDISETAATDELFLRIENFAGTTGEPWTAVDNLIIVPETPVPVFTLQPQDHFGFVGESVTLPSLAAAEPEPTYQWQFSEDGFDPWQDLAGETNASLIFDSLQLADNGYYRVIATNENGETTSAEVLVDAIYPDPTINQQPGPAGGFAGATVQLAVTATGLGNLSYQWFKVDTGGDIELADGGNISGTTTATLEISDLSAADEGEYYVIVTDDAAIPEEGFPTEAFSDLATVTIVDLLVTASPTAPATDGFDEFHLPGNIDDIHNIDGSPGGVPIAESGTNDASTYVAPDRTSQGMTFTTKSDPLGYTIDSITVRHVLWDNYLGNGTYYDIQDGDTFEFQFGTIDAGVKTPIFDTDAAQYSGGALTTPAQPDNLGSGNYLTFDLSQAGIGTLSPNTTYYFEIASEIGDPFFELSGTSVDNYNGGTVFRGSAVGTIDSTYVELAGDRAFHVDLTGLSGSVNDFASWIAGFPGVGAMTGFDDDADGDGLSNGAENYLGTDPGTPNAGLTSVSKNGATFSFLHPQNATPAIDTAPAYRWSLDLGSWHADGATVGDTTVNFTVTPGTPIDGTTTVTATLSGTIPTKLFADLQVTQEAP